MSTVEPGVGGFISYKDSTTGEQVTLNDKQYAAEMQKNVPKVLASLGVSSDNSTENGTETVSVKRKPPTLLAGSSSVTRI